MQWYQSWQPENLWKFPVDRDPQCLGRRLCRTASFATIECSGTSAHRTFQPLRGLSRTHHSWILNEYCM